MDDPHEAKAAAEHVDAALEATCESLVALQLIRALGADDLHGGEGQATNAIKLVQRAITELRALRLERTSVLAFGFVAGAPATVAGSPPPAASPGAPAVAPPATPVAPDPERPSQSRPRRTA
jgi:hypothetical protein